ncbi:MAG: SAVED domain-containing protein [Cyanothece sp. SIO1E1]|nr:SAVED domain-containing protein [Cyanothece sp. SIO1E1]
MTKKILILTANPRGTQRLSLDREVRDIEEALQRSQQRDQFDIRPKWAVRPRDVARAILDYQPQIIQFSGHGAGEDGILLEDEVGQVKRVSSEALSGLFQLFSDHLECVVLNACYSEEQAKVICQYIDYVIGMNAEIGDRSAIEFAVGFYDALGAGRDYDFAYNLGCQYIVMAGIQQVDVPSLRKKKSLLNSTIRLGVNGSGEKEYDIPPDRVLDWTAHYDFNIQPRKLADSPTWEQILLPQLRQTREELSQGRFGLTLELSGKIPLSAAFVIGTVFQETLGYTLQVEQWTGKPSLWRSDATPSQLKFRVEQTQGQAGKNLGIALAVSRQVWSSVQSFYKQSDQKLDAIVYLEPDTEAGACDRALSSDADAVALVEHAKQLIDHYRQHYQATQLHLIFACPMGFAALLGHRLRAVGEVITYEQQLTMEQRYVQSAKLLLT